MQRKIRILQLQSAAKLAGTEVSTERLIRNMNKDEFENDICFFLGDGPISEVYRKNNFKVEVLNFNGKNIIPIVIQLFKIIKKGKYDIINIYGYKINILGRIIAFLCGNKNVVTAQRSIDGQRKWIHSFIDKATSIFVKLYISNSEAARQVLISREKISPDKIITIYNGLNIEDYSSILDKDLIYSKLGLKILKSNNNSIKIITAVGNLLQPKGHTYLIDAVKILDNEDIKDFVVLFAGEGELRKTLEEKVRKLNLTERIIFLGSRKDIPDILSVSDIFVLPSIWEGLPGSIMEAMSSSLPVVATDVGGVSEIVANDKTGFIVEPQKPEQLADKIKVLLFDDHLRNSMGKEGFKRVKESYSLEKMVSRYEKAYRSLLKD